MADCKTVPIDLTALSDLQRQGLACIRCGARGPDQTMRPISTPGNPQSTMVFVHVSPCVRRQQPMTAERLRDYLRAALMLHVDISDVRDTQPLAMDRLAVIATDSERVALAPRLCNEARPVWRSAVVW